jgi:hypothetical protein
MWALLPPFVASETQGGPLQRIAPRLSPHRCPLCSEFAKDCTATIPPRTTLDHTVKRVAILLDRPFNSNPVFCRDAILDLSKWIAIRRESVHNQRLRLYRCCMRKTGLLRGRRIEIGRLLYKPL